MEGSKLSLNKSQFKKWFLENYTPSEILSARQYKKDSQISEDYLIQSCISRVHCKVMILDNKMTFHKSLTYKEMQRLFYDRFNAIKPTPRFFSVWSVEEAVEISITPSTETKVIDGKVW